MKYLFFYLLFGCSLLSLTTLAQQKPAETKKTTAVERDLEKFRDWVNAKINSNDTVTATELPQHRKDYNQHTSRLDSSLSALSEKTKQEYQLLKVRYQQWETDKKARQAEPLNPEELKQWEKQLLGEFAPARKLKKQELQPAFQHFMEQARSKQNNWSPRDWDYIHAVYQQITNRKKKLDLTTSEELKLATWQVEYNTIRTGQHTRNLYQNLKSEK
ncbi:MAG: hypothetical protein LPJ89_02425 [Hymenobacteraceae bacterium]|nr:hypothetical protein [Hymenobacteraceae bacterium]